MTTTDNKALVERFEREFKNNKNLGVVDELFAADFRHTLPFPGLPQGRDGLKAAGAAIFESFAHEHLKVALELVLADGDRVITRTRVSARHTGAWNGIPATGKDVGWTETNIYRVKDGKVVELIGEGNFLGVMMQLGSGR